jgi:two-component system sensor histidine kinase PhoQ
MHILVVEDEPRLREQLRDRLRHSGYVVDVAADGEEGLYYGEEYPLDLAIIDIGLPKLSGIELIQRLRARDKHFPILILTARGNWQDKVDGLETGADDYLVKPFRFEELEARLNALLRRASGWSKPVLDCGPISLDTVKQAITVAGKPVELTAFEYRVLEYLMLHAGEVISKTELTDNLYEQDYDRDSNVHSRLLLAASLVLAGFLGATGLALDKAFRVSAKAAMQDRLQSHIYALLAAADEDDNGRMIPPRELPEPRFSKPDSGLYAIITGTSGDPLWHSGSLTGRDLDLTDRQQPGERRFSRLTRAGLPLYALAFGVAWEDFAGTEALYTFTVAEDTTVFQAEIDSFRSTLWRWLGGMALVLLLAQGVILRWGLRPLRTVTRDLQQIEKGHAERLDGRYPRELAGLTSSLNSLIEHGKAVQVRYRNSLDNLAHSLKTPLAILQSGQPGSSGDLDAGHSLVREQVERMDAIISHQLQRAAVSGRTTLAKPVPVGTVVERLVRSLDKVYREKAVAVELELDPTVTFTGDEADLTEILGNLLENAYKYCRRVVQVCVQIDQHSAGIEIQIGDDGPGIAANQVDTVLQRGQRMDESVPGQGLGLSMANEIITVYGGQLAIAASPLGGTLLRVSFND